MVRELFTKWLNALNVFTIVIVTEIYTQMNTAPVHVKVVTV
jgi:hypothetical protein